MPEIKVEAEATVGATPERVYAVLSDYRTGHPGILPPQFSALAVEEGGTGAGTVFRVSMTLAGRTRGIRMRVDEPEPGRVLRERDVDSDLVTTFFIDPSGAGSRVRIVTTWSRSGLRGWMERLLAPRMLRPVYLDELARLAAALA